MLKKNYRIPIYLLPLLLTGCRSNEEAIIGLGFGMVLLFLAYWAISIVLPKIQNISWLKSLIKKAKKPLKIIANILIFGFGILAIISVTFGDGVYILFGAVFGIGIVGMHYLKLWANTEDGNESKLELKMIILSITFIFALIWLIFFGGHWLNL